MGKLRFLFALWMAKLSIPALKITHHNGTDFPGSLCRQTVPRLSALRGQAQNHRGRHRHQRQDHGVQHAQRHSGGRRPPRAEQPRRQQYRLRRVHRLHPELRPAGPREKVRHGGAGGGRALRPQNLPLCEAGLHRGHQSVPRLHHAQRPPRLHRGHPDPLLPQIVQADFECRRSDPPAPWRRRTPGSTSASTACPPM